MSAQVAWRGCSVEARAEVLAALNKMRGDAALAAQVHELYAVHFDDARKRGVKVLHSKGEYVALGDYQRQVEAAFVAALALLVQEADAAAPEQP